MNKNTLLIVLSFGCLFLCVGSFPCSRSIACFSCLTYPHDSPCMWNTYNRKCLDRDYASLAPRNESGQLEPSYNTINQSQCTSTCVHFCFTSTDWLWIGLSLSNILVMFPILLFVILVDYNSNNFCVEENLDQSTSASKYSSLPKETTNEQTSAEEPNNNNAKERYNIVYQKSVSMFATWIMFVWLVDKIVLDKTLPNMSGSTTTTTVSSIFFSE